MYINGIARPESEKSILQFTGTDPNDGTLVIGRGALRTPALFGNIWMDELIIWQEQITAEDVIKLYQAYQ